MINIAVVNFKKTKQNEVAIFVSVYLLQMYPHVFTIKKNKNTVYVF